MIKRDWDLLFSDQRLDVVSGQQMVAAEAAVRAITEQQFVTKPDELLIGSVVSQFLVRPLEIIDGTEVSSREAKVDVSHDPNRHFFEPGPHYVDGLEVIYHVPFKGDPSLWKCQPNRYTWNPPRAVVGRTELRFPYDQANRDVAATRKEFEIDLSKITQWIGWINDQVEAFNDTLSRQITELIRRRRQEISRTTSDLEKLPFPIRESPSATRPPTTALDTALTEHRGKKSTEHGYEYDIALSFAGEDRKYVKRVAETLVAAATTVFYDEFEKASLWGRDLLERFDDVYSTASRFVVMFISKHYVAKVWPSQERQFALSRRLEGETDRVLPVRFDNTDIPGLASTIGYIDARVVAPEELADLIRQKLDTAKA